MLKPALDRIPREIAAAADYEGLAAQHLEASTLAWIAGGSGDEVTLRANRSAFSQIALRGRLWGSARNSTVTTNLNLLGQDFAHPLLLAPVATQALLHPQAELASAQGAEAMDAGMVLSTLASTSMENVAKEVSRRWLQLYWQQNLERTMTLVQRAERSGYTALVLTLDTPVQSLSRAAQRLGFQIPAHLRAVNLDGLPPLPPSTERCTAIEAMLRQAATLDDIRALVTHTQLPVLVKGVLNAEDARELLACGVQGFVVSNHGGRALDSGIATLSALPAMRAAVGPDVPLLLDSGIRSGYDVFKALALGADAVLLGRLQAWALASAGALGVAHMLKIVLEELQLCMALCGCATLAEIKERTPCC
ncbi:MAG: alpha-hydroxy acid oxidase [Pseudomonadota bacterium]